MAIPQNKEELITAIRTTSQRFKSELEKDVSGEQCMQKTMEGHSKNTLISPYDLVSYLIGWGELVLKWHKIKSEGLEPDFPEKGYKWNELGKLAQKFYQDYENESYEALLKKYDKTISSILEIIEQESDETLYRAEWYKKHTMGRMIQLNTSSPYKNAYVRIRKWKKEQEEKTR